MSEHIKCLIIGSGPAGYTAAIYAARANMAPVMYMGLQPGGQLTITNDVENFPGYADGVNGPQMMEDLKRQAARFGTDIRYGIATAVDFSVHPRKVTIDETVELTADAVIIATGASAKWLGLPSEAKLNGSGVSACAVCDGFFYRGQEVAIVGAGDTAAEEATYLANLCSKVTMIVRKSEMKASKIMQQRVLKNPKIEVLFNTVTDEILGEHSVEGVRVKNLLSPRNAGNSPDGLFCGHWPRAQFQDFSALPAPRRAGLPQNPARHQQNQRRRRVCLRRRAGLHLPPGHHGGRAPAAWRRSTRSVI
jgi:thioredoxin reductase (NADPH)